jgi:hypothetical protein
VTVLDTCVQAAAGVTCQETWAARLYERAKSEQWGLDDDIDWRAIELTGLPPAIRRALARIYSHVQAGEILALVMTARAVDAAPELWAKMFGATQLMDEARHVEFFARVVAMLGEPVTLSESMRQMVGEMSELRSMDEILLGTQIVLEGYAQCLFLEGARLGSRAAGRRVRLPATSDPGPFLSAVSRYVGRDESRHVAFGVLYLRDRWAAIDRIERSRLQDLGYRFGSLLDAIVSETRADLSRVGVDATDLLAHVQRARATHFQHIGFDT